MWVTSSTAKVLTPNAIALGNFDGIHRGHQQVLQPILNGSRVIGCSSLVNGKEKEKNHTYVTVVTFNPHPREFFTGQSRKLLTPLQEKVKQLELLGVEQLVLLPFDRELASLSPQQFVEEILVQQLQASLISVGEDFRFGHKRAGTAADLQAIAAKFGIEAKITSEQTCQGNGDDGTVRISSSLIRQALEQGEISQANRMLGRAYTLTGSVVTGEKLGRTIGFPTANLQLPPSKFLPRYGVYCVRVFLEEEKPLPTHQSLGCSKSKISARRLANHQSPIKGVMNLGCRPTVDGTTPTLEVHLLDWTGDLYGQTITVSLEKFLRSEQKFPSLEALKAQIAADCNRAREIMKL
ncbi:MAG: bifunctional riboflavin kinase/FAD synthetase [Xenococcaceae cyanobacterium]